MTFTTKKGEPEFAVDRNRDSLLELAPGRAHARTPERTFFELLQPPHERKAVHGYRHIARTARTRYGRPRAHVEAAITRFVADLHPRPARGKKRHGTDTRTHRDHQKDAP